MAIQSNAMKFDVTQYNSEYGHSEALPMSQIRLLIPTNPQIIGAHSLWQGYCMPPLVSTTNATCTYIYVYMHGDNCHRVINNLILCHVYMNVQVHGRYVTSPALNVYYCNNYCQLQSNLICPQIRYHGISYMQVLEYVIVYECKCHHKSPPIT